MTVVLRATTGKDACDTAYRGEDACAPLLPRIGCRTGGRPSRPSTQTVGEPPSRSRRRDACAPLLPRIGCRTGGRPSRPSTESWENRLPAVAGETPALPFSRASAAGPEDGRLGRQRNRGRTAFPQSQARTPALPFSRASAAGPEDGRLGRQRNRGRTAFPQSQARTPALLYHGHLARDCALSSRCRDHRQGCL